MPEHGRQRAGIGGVRPARLSTTLTIGIDLASQPAGTALCAIAWADGGARATNLTRGKWDTRQLADDLLLEVMRGETELGAPVKVAIDAPFGWPEPFVDAVGGHHDRTVAWPRTRERRDFALRRTDVRVHEQVKRFPLSVSTDRIAHCAMRCAGLLGELEASLGAAAVARDGGGRVVEAYPEAALRRWLPELWVARETYKGKQATARRGDVIDALLEKLGASFDLAGRRAACISSDDSLDALVCALVARAAACGETVRASAEDEQLACSEGWIHVPREGSLGRLYDPSS